MKGYIFIDQDGDIWGDIIKAKDRQEALRKASKISGYTQTEINRYMKIKSANIK